MTAPSEGASTGEAARTAADEGQLRPRERLRCDARDGLEHHDVLMGRSTPFVGRAKELAMLHASLRECLDDEVARAILVTAPPGAGKSRLCRELVARTRREHAAQVLFARCDPTGAGSPFALIQRLIHHAAGVRASDPAALRRQTLRTYLRTVGGEAAEAQHLEGLSALIDVDGQAASLHGALSGDPETLRERKRRAFIAWLGAELGRGPILLFLEDVHWGDLPSLGFLEAALQELAEQPLFGLATARPELHVQCPKLRDDPFLAEIVLHGLTRKAAAQLARAVLPDDTDEAVIGEIVQRSGGNAFYLEELMRQICEGGGAALPASVAAMARSRLERLPGAAQRVLGAASVFGDTCWASGIDGLEGTDDATRLLDWLSTQEILEPQTDSRFPTERAYRFRHALVREGAYAMLSDADRRTGHLHAAEWLETHGERDPRVLGDHFERGGAIARAIPWITKASMAAHESGDFETAITLSHRGTSLGAYADQRGMLLLVRARASASRSDPELPAEALSLLPRASAPWWLALSLYVSGWSVLGKPEQSEPYLQLALDTAPDAALMVAHPDAIHALSAAASLLGRADLGWALVRHFEHAAMVHGTEHARGFRAWAGLSKCILATNAIDGDHWALGRALSWGRGSVAAMRALGSSSGEAAATFHFGHALWQAGDYEQSLVLLQQARSLAKKTGNLQLEGLCSVMLAVSAMREESRAEALATLVELAASGNSVVSHAAATELSDYTQREGRPAEAIARARQAASGCSLMYRRMACCTLARAHLTLGQHAEALSAVAKAFADGGDAAFPQLTLDLLGSRARAWMATGAHAQAERTIALACRIRATTAAGIDDVETRHAFVSRGQANGVLDALVARNTCAHEPS